MADKGTPYPTRRGSLGGDPTGSKYLDDVKQWKLDNPLAAKELAAKELKAKQNKEPTFRQKLKAELDREAEELRAKRAREKAEREEAKQRKEEEWYWERFQAPPEMRVAKGGLIKSKKNRNASIDYRKSGMFSGGMVRKTKNRRSK